MAASQIQGFYSYNLNRYSLRNFSGVYNINVTVPPPAPGVLLGNLTGDTILNFTGTTTGTLVLPTPANIQAFFRGEVIVLEI